MQAIKSDPTKTVLTICVGFIVLHFVFGAQWLLIVALVVGLIGVFSTYLSALIEKVWIKLAMVLSLIVPNVLLTVIFYVFLFPVAALSRIFSKKDPLFLKNTSPSIYKDVDKEFDPESFENPW